MRSRHGPGALLAQLLDLVFPPACVGCGARGLVLCPACIATIEVPAVPLCAGCHRPLPTTERGSVQVGLCASCRALGDVALSGLRIAARYGGVIRAAIWALKYAGEQRLADPLGDLLAATAAREVPGLAAIATPAAATAAGMPGAGVLPRQGQSRAIGAADMRDTLLIPVPLHPSRVRQRGFNQAELLARACGDELHLAVRSDLLARTRATPPQVGRNAAERRTNVAGAFAVLPEAAGTLAGRRVMLVDDVCTTGATLAAAAAALRASGAIEVWGLTVAQPVLGADAAPPPRAPAI